MNNIELTLFEIKYLAAQVFYHVPRECGTFWWMISFAIVAVICSGLLLGRRVARQRRERSLRAALTGDCGPFG
jgi:uncharacterized membrane protein YciS (DUF1049 family)